LPQRSALRVRFLGFAQANMASHAVTWMLGVLIMSWYHSSISVRLEGLSLDDMEEADNNNIPEEKEAERQEECSSAVAGASWLKRKTCACGEGLTVVCPGEPCNAYERLFKAKDFEQKSGCQCQMCDTSCESVPGASRRPRRMWGRDCACEKGFRLSGSDKACQKSWGKGRFFSSKKVIDRGCSCTSDQEEGATVEEEGEFEAAEEEQIEEETEEEETEEEEEEVPTEKPEEPEEEPAPPADAERVRMLPVDPHADSVKEEEEVEEEVAPPSASNLLEDIKKPDVAKAVMFGVGLLVLGGGCVTLVICVFKGGNGEDIPDEDH